MPTRSVRIVRVPINLGDDGLSPDDILKLCNELKNYILAYRLPRELHGLRLWVEPKLNVEEGELRLVLLLSHDGQLPLNYTASKDVTPDIAITRDLDALASNIEQALSESNDVWFLAADIANHDVDPAGEMEHLRWTSGYPAPSRPRAAAVPSVLQVMTRQDVLVLESPEIAPEYIESHELQLCANTVVKDGALFATVVSHQPATYDNDFISRIADHQQLRLRWPEKDRRAWDMMASVAALVEMSMDLVGHGVVSMHTLNGKAIDVREFRNPQAIIDRLLEIVAPVVARARN